MKIEIFEHFIIFLILVAVFPTRYRGNLFSRFFGDKMTQSFLCWVAIKRYAEADGTPCNPGVGSKERRVACTSMVSMPKPRGASLSNKEEYKK